MKTFTKKASVSPFTKFKGHMIDNVSLVLFEAGINAYLEQIQTEAAEQGKDVPLLVCDTVVPMCESDLDRAMLAAGSAEEPEYITTSSIQMLSSRAVVGEEEGRTLHVYQCKGVGYTLFTPIFPGVVVVFVLREAQSAPSETATVH